MCRFIAYLGHPIILHDVLFKPKNSLISQSIHAREMSEPLNGDGFGVGWYVHEIDNSPALFKSIQPAWNDMNLENLAGKIRTDSFFAHIRAASQGGVNILNTHPFNYKNLLFMHNGDIGEFSQIKRFLRREFSDEVYDWVKGQTDSEHLFALFIELFNRKNLHFIANNAAEVFKETIEYLEKMRSQHQLTETSYINAVIGDGKALVAVRYISNPKEKAPTLYYAAGGHYEYFEGVCHIRPTKTSGENGAVLITSEKLTSHKAEWIEIPVNHMLLVYHDLSTELRAL